MIKGLSARVVLSLAVLGVVATGCTTGGTATPGPTGATTTERTSEATTSTKPSNGGDALADFDPCEVINSVAAQLNLTEIEESGARECLAEYSTTASVSLVKQPELAIGDAVGGEMTDISVGSHKAKLVKTPTTSSSCMVTIEVTATSRVDVTSSTNASLDEACAAATAVAEAVEPKLPK
ncbi:MULTISPECIES: DUF3558 family protein [Saccharothrix]|uniref:DUF3558 family protein n=1 Tax=Saccharothrix TaxID=2071 RepID=UPI00094061B9|nr:DUF3558 family protein [Saccharothrix sp. CB00851]OKI39134.1 hypothetical protein A6A25_02895 [Saccharothrix sp. CB00851]